MNVADVIFYIFSFTSNNRGITASEVQMARRWEDSRQGSFSRGERADIKLLTQPGRGVRACPAVMKHGVSFTGDSNYEFLNDHV